MRLRSARFLSVGYASTTLAAVAADASVSVDTVYRTFGSKRGLLAAVMDVNDGGDDESVAVLDREMPQRMRAEQDQRVQVALFASGMAGELERMRPLDDVLRRVKAVGKFTGIYAPSGARAGELARKGFDMVCIGSDMSMLKAGAQAALGAAQG